MDTKMTLLEELAVELAKAYPKAKIELDRPMNPNASAWLDFTLGTDSAEIEWRQDLGLGISVNAPATYGLKSDEIYPSVELALSRLKQLFDNHESTSKVAT